MSLREFQTVLARMCLDRSFRAAIKKDRGVLGAYKLRPNELASLYSMDLAAVEQFGEHLIEKRIRLITQWFPLTFRLLRFHREESKAIDLLAAFTQRIMRADSEVGGHWLRTESARAAEYLKELAVTGVFEAPHLLDLIAFEFEKLRLCTDPEAMKSARREPNPSLPGADLNQFVQVPQHVSVVHLQCDISEVIGNIELDRDSLLVECAESSVLLIRRPAGTEVDTFILGDGSVALLNACRTPVSIEVAIQLATTALEALPSNAFLEDCRIEMRRLLQLGALVLIR